MLGNVPNSDLLNLWAPPTIEELDRRPFNTSDQFDAIATGRRCQSFGWLPFSTRRSIPIQASDRTKHQLRGADSTGRTRSYVTGVAGAHRRSDRRILAGQCLAHDCLRDLPTTSRHTLSAWSKYGSRFTIPDLACRSTLRLVGPRRSPRHAAGSAEEDALGVCRRFCSNSSNDLADSAYSAQWASHVSNQLHALTEREQLEGDDVQSILADLSDSAQEACRMADNTDDDRAASRIVAGTLGLGAAARLLGRHARRARGLSLPGPRCRPR